jgi:hypothetical protein
MILLVLRIFCLLTLKWLNVIAMQCIATTKERPTQNSTFVTKRTKKGRVRKTVTVIVST